MGLCEMEVLWVVGKEKENEFAGRKWVRVGGGLEEGKERRLVVSMVVVEEWRRVRACVFVAYLIIINVHSG